MMSVLHNIDESVDIQCFAISSESVFCVVQQLITALTGVCSLKRPFTSLHILLATVRTRATKRHKHLLKFLVQLFYNCRTHTIPRSVQYTIIIK